MKLLTLAAVTALLSLPAHADGVTIYTGAEGGGYDGKAREIAQRLEQRGLSPVIQNRKGSDDITLQACSSDNPAVWIAQKDALYKREIQDGCPLVDLVLYGKEYAMIFFPPESDQNELSDLSASDTVLIDRVGSGSELAWRNMAAIEKEHGRGNEWSDAQTATKSVKRATSMASRGTVQAVFLVRTLNSADVTSLLEQGWELGEMYDRDINDLEWNGAPLYEAEKVTLTLNGKKAGKDWAYVIPSYIGTTAAVERGDEDTFEAILSALN